MFDELAKKGLSLSIIVGTLLVPVTALAAIWLTDSGQGPEETSVAATAAPVTTVATEPTTTSTIDVAADLETACGSEGMQLVSLEEAEAITDVQQAALDALREVCEQQGIPLPARVVPEPIVQTVVVPAVNAASPSPVSTPTTLDDDVYVHDDHEEYEHEDEEYEHEDDGHEREDDGDRHEDDGDHEHEDHDRGREDD